MAQNRRPPRGPRGPQQQKTFWQKYQWYIILGVAFLFIITVILPAVSGQQTNQEPAPSGDQTTDGSTRSTTLSGIKPTPYEGRGHILPNQSATYFNIPPVTGQHWATTAPWGIDYDQPIRDELLVHNLEHGGIVFNYRSGLPTDQIQQLRDLVRGLPNAPTGYIVAPYQTFLPTPIVVRAWEYRLDLSIIDEGRIQQFVNDHYDNACETLQGQSNPNTTKNCES